MFLNKRLPLPFLLLSLLASFAMPVLAEDSKDKDSDKENQDNGPFSPQHRVRTIFYIIGLCKWAKSCFFSVGD
ncbi:hypothetical protein DL96DRAFT_1126266 [Flagelloscypha sp. PMI_526]|nr:hypothetical protein DL96DRAFT_1126266 [Flagelloscypha sp. PMI_526]